MNHLKRSYGSKVTAWRRIAIRCLLGKKTERAFSELGWAGRALLRKYAFGSGKRTRAKAPPLNLTGGAGTHLSASPFLSLFSFSLFFFPSPRDGEAWECVLRSTAGSAATCRRRPGARRRPPGGGEGRPVAPPPTRSTTGTGEPRMCRHGGVLYELAAGGSRTGPRPRATILQKGLSGRL